MRKHIIQLEVKCPNDMNETEAKSLISNMLDIGLADAEGSIGADIESHEANRALKMKIKTL